MHPVRLTNKSISIQDFAESVKLIFMSKFSFSAPPSYDSLYGRIKRAHEEEDALGFMQSSFNIMGPTGKISICILCTVSMRLVCRHTLVFFSSRF